MPGMSCVAPTAAFYAMPQVSLPPGRTDEQFIVGLLRATGVLCVYGSGFGTRPEDGFFRVVFSPPLTTSPASTDGSPSPRPTSCARDSGPSAVARVSVGRDGGLRGADAGHDVAARHATDDVAAVRSRRPAAQLLRHRLGCDPRAGDPFGRRRCGPPLLARADLSSRTVRAGVLQHLVAQAVQVTPIYALSGNILLCYNLLFLSTFVLSALGMPRCRANSRGPPRPGSSQGSSMGLRSIGSPNSLTCRRCRRNGCRLRCTGFDGSS